MPYVIIGVIIGLGNGYSSVYLAKMLTYCQLEQTSEIWIKMHAHFFVKKMHVSHTFSSGVDVLTHWPLGDVAFIIFKLIIQKSSLDTQCEIALSRMP